MENSIESLFSDEYSLFPVGAETRVMNDWGITLSQNIPNPFHGITGIIVELNRQTGYNNAAILIHNMAGTMIDRLPVALNPGENFLELNLNGRSAGYYTYSLELNGRIISVRKMFVY